MSYQVINPFIQFVDPATGRPLSGGSVYFGRMDTDPKNQPANRLNVYAVQDNGSETLLAQPITLNGAGQPQYAGSVKQIKVQTYLDEPAYSIQLFNSSGSQKGYSPRVYTLEETRFTIVSFDTLADAAAQDLTIGQLVTVVERSAGNKGMSNWLVQAASGANGIDKVVMSNASKMLVYQFDVAVSLDALGAGNGGGNDADILQRATAIGDVIEGNPAKTLTLSSAVTTAGEILLRNVNVSGGTVLFNYNTKMEFCAFNSTLIIFRYVVDTGYISAWCSKCSFVGNTLVSDLITIQGGLNVRFEDCTFGGTVYRWLKTLPLRPDETTTAASMTENIKVLNCNFTGVSVRQAWDGYSGTSDIEISGCKASIECEVFFEHKLKGSTGYPFQTKHTAIRITNNVISVGGASNLGVYLVQGAYGAAGTSQTTFQTFTSVDNEITSAVINSFNAAIDVRGFNFVEIRDQHRKENSNTYPSIQCGSNQYVKVLGGYYQGRIDGSAVSYSGQAVSPGYTLRGEVLHVDNAIVDYSAVGGVNSETFNVLRVTNSDFTTALASGASAIVGTNIISAFLIGNTHPSGTPNRANLAGTLTLVINRDNSWSLPIRTGDSAYTYAGEWFYNSTTSKWNIKTSGGLKNYDGTPA